MGAFRDLLAKLGLSRSPEPEQAPRPETHALPPDRDRGEMTSEIMEKRNEEREQEQSGPEPLRYDEPGQS